jgi:hypothetical protein
VEDRPRHEYWLKDRDLLLRNYRVEITNREEIVADRSGVALEVRSRYPGRPSLRLVLDEATGLLLDFRLFDWKGKPAITSRFTSLLLDPGLPEEPEQPDPWSWNSWGWKFGDWKGGDWKAGGWKAGNWNSGNWKSGGTGKAGFVPPGPWNRFKKVPGPVTAEIGEKLGFPPFVPRYLPEGFRLKATYEGYGRNRLLKTVYSDGLSWIEMYQRQAREPEEDRVVHESTRCSRTRMSLCLDGVKISIEGRLDPEVLREVVKSLGVVGGMEP